MIRKLVLFSCMLILLGCKTNMSEQKLDKFSIVTGKYMGQERPDFTPRIFAPNIVSTAMSELNAVFSPDYKEFYYSIYMPNKKYVIMPMRYDGRIWTKPEVADFSGRYSDADPFITADGNWLYYISKRPLDPCSKEKKDWDIWRMKKVNGKWSNPQHLDSPVNSEADDLYPCLTNNGSLYFTSARKGVLGGRDVFCARKNGDGFSEPKRLNDSINRNWEGDTYVSPDEDYMIITSYGRPGGGGLHISFNKDGKWSDPQNMGKDINVTGRELCPIVSPDGKYFFYTSTQTKESNRVKKKLCYADIMEQFTKSYNNPQMGKRDIYWIDAKIINTYRNNK